MLVKIQAKDGRFFAKTTGVIRAKIQAKFKFVISASVCDLVHVQSVVDLFSKQLNNALNVH